MAVVAIEEEVIQGPAPLRLVDPVELFAVFDEAYEAGGIISPGPPVVARQIDEQVLAVMQALSKALAVRAMLALSIIGTFVLAMIAIFSPTWMALAVVLMFAGATVAPLTYLAQQRH